MKTITLHYDESKVIPSLSQESHLAPAADGFNVFNLVIEDDSGIAIIIATRDPETVREEDFAIMMEGLSRLGALTVKGYVHLHKTQQEKK